MGITSLRKYESGPQNKGEGKKKKEGVERAKGQGVSLFPSGYQQIQWPTVRLAIIWENSVESANSSQQAQIFQNLEGFLWLGARVSPFMQYSKCVETKSAKIGRGLYWYADFRCID